MADLYHYPRLSRLDLGVLRSPGPGLGNLLFPIARALIGRQIHGGTFVYPTMRQVKIGPVLRGEIDKRTYGDVLRPRRTSDWREWAAAHLVRAAGEHALPAGGGANPGADARIVYEGLGDYFLALAGHAPMVRQWLAANGQFSGLLAEDYDIAVHVRLADFTDDDGSHDGFNIRQPWTWYRAALDEARRRSGKDAPTIRLFADVAPAQALSGIGTEGATVDAAGNALTAMMNLSRARILVTSRSTFSMWGAFLGNCTAIWNGRMDVARYFPVAAGRDIVVSA